MPKLTNPEIEDIERAFGHELPGLYHRLLFELGFGLLGPNAEIFHPLAVRELDEPFFDGPGQLFNRYFPFGGYGSDSADRVELTQRAIERGGRLIGHELDHARVQVVGDTPKDLDAAHGAGCVGIGVATGHYSAEELGSAGADHVLTSLRDPYPGVDE